MAKPQISRAVDLARQAAEAARAELAESEGAAAAAAPISGHANGYTGGQASGPWQPLTLQGFRLNPAMQQAVQQVASHLARALHYEGLAVDVAELSDVAAPAMAETPHTATKAGSLPPPAQTQVQVKEGNNGRLVRGYSTAAVLSLFASQHQRNGIVVDGQI